MDYTYIFLKDADPDLPVVDDAKKRQAGLKNNQKIAYRINHLLGVTI
jgi:hypothetical protein